MCICPRNLSVVKQIFVWFLGESECFCLCVWIFRERDCFQPDSEREWTKPAPDVSEWILILWIHNKTTHNKNDSIIRPLPPKPPPKGMHETARNRHGAFVRARPLQGQNVRRLLRGDHREERPRAALRHSAQLQSHLLPGVHSQVALGQAVRQQDHAVSVKVACSQELMLLLRLQARNILYLLNWIEFLFFVSPAPAPSAGWPPTTSARASTGWTRRRRRKRCWPTIAWRSAKRTASTSRRATASVRSATNASTSMRWPTGRAWTLGCRRGRCAGRATTWARWTRWRTFSCGTFCRNANTISGWASRSSSPTTNTTMRMRTTTTTWARSLSGRWDALYPGHWRAPLDAHRRPSNPPMGRGEPSTQEQDSHQTHTKSIQNGCSLSLSLCVNISICINIFIIISWIRISLTPFSLSLTHPHTHIYT